MTSSKSSAAPPNARTLGVELVVGELLSLPLMRENVFHSAKYLDGIIEKEVADLLLVHRGEVIVVSIKAQEKPRDASATFRWATGAIDKAVRQVGGAYKTLSTKDAWCVQAAHTARFRAGELRPRHGLALVESQFEMGIEVEPGLMERLRKVAPVSLMTIADFVRLAAYLRTWRDLNSYLSARANSIKGADASVVGAERPLFVYYTAACDSFAGCGGIADAKIVQAARPAAPAAAQRDRERAQAELLEKFIERISDAGDVAIPDGEEALRQFLPGVAEGTRASLRDEFCDLTVQERAAVGEQVSVTCDATAKDDDVESMRYGAVRLPRFPEKLLLVVASKGTPHGEATVAGIDALIAGCVHYRRETGILLLANQLDGAVHFSLGRVVEVHPTVEMTVRGVELFGHVKPRKVKAAR